MLDETLINIIDGSEHNRRISIDQNQQRKYFNLRISGRRMTILKSNLPGEIGTAICKSAFGDGILDVSFNLKQNGTILYLSAFTS